MSERHIPKQDPNKKLDWTLIKRLWAASDCRADFRAQLGYHAADYLSLGAVRKWETEQVHSADRLVMGDVYKRKAGRHC